jgi:nitrite reductase/ring-hydroxylating ferredoxin subunit
LVNRRSPVYARPDRLTSPEPPMPEYSAGKITDFAEGGRKVLACGEHEVGVFLVDGQFYAWHNRCSHRAGPVCQGRIMKRVIEPVDADRQVRALAYHEDTHIVCPWHGYEFNIKTGRNQGNPAARLRKVDIRLRDGEVYVCL